MNNRMMKVKELRNDQGLISGLVISADDIMELKTSLKPDSSFFQYVENLQADIDHIKRASSEIMPNGLTLAESNKRMAKATEDLHRSAFERGIPMYYRDERTNPPKEFVRANPDGSEDLVSLDLDTDQYSLIKRLAQPGKGYWSYLLKAE